MFLILSFEIYIIGLFLVSHADTRSGLRSYLKLTAVLGGAGGPTRPLWEDGLMPPVKDPPSSHRCQD